MAEIVNKLHAKQVKAFTSDATEILYGGAAGGGKSHLIRIDAVTWAFSVPGIQIYLFRRKYKDLYLNHMDGPTGFPMLLADYVDAGIVRVNRSNNEIVFNNGSKIHLCHCQYEDDVTDYQGAEIHVLYIDELTHFTEYMYRFLRSRVRLGSLKVPAEFRHRLPRIMAGSNPGSVGHAWVKDSFVNYCVPYEIKQTPKEEGGKLRQFIPALLEDNPSMDAGYEMTLEGLGSPDLVKAMRYGLWDITAGAAFEKLSRDKHMLRTFTPPEWWTKFMSIDWGYSHPFSVGWYCVCDDDLELEGKDDWPTRFIPRGSIIRYREWYGCTGKANEGVRMDADEVARKIVDLEDDYGEEIDYRIGDSQMWASDNGPSVQSEMYDATDGIVALTRSKKDRITNYQRVRNAIAGKDGFPKLYITANCKNFWRTIPDLQLDDRHPEKGPDTNMEDHVYDEVAYGLCTDAPIMTREERDRIEYQEARRKATGNKGFYATG